MKIKKSRLGLSILAGGLSFVGAANATDIVIDGSFESSVTPPGSFIGHGGNDAAGIDGGWTSFSTYTYSANYTQPGPAGCGLVYLRPYTDDGGTQTPSQVNNLLRAIPASDIDKRKGAYTFSAWFSTYKNQNDYSDLTLQFLDESLAPVGNPVALGGKTFVSKLAKDPTTLLSAWGKDSKSGAIPRYARYASITNVSYALAGWPDGYVDLVKLDVTTGVVPVLLTSADPADGATGVGPGATLSVTLEDGTSDLNTNSVLFWYDNSLVSPVIQKPKNGTTTTVRYTPPALMASMSSHSYKVAFDSTGGTTANTTNQYSFTVAPYVNVNLGTPIARETFDGIAPGALPAGWTVANNTDLSVVFGYDLNNFLSDTFVDWTVISTDNLANWFTVTWGTASPGSWYYGVTNVAPNQVVNNALVTNLISTNFIIAVSGRYESDNKQIDYVYTGDYNLSGRNNVYLSFHNIYVQNENNIASVEYSIDGGATWQPALYMLDPSRIFRDGTGNIDAYATFNWSFWWDVPGGQFGQYIGVDSSRWSTLGPFISPRVDDDQYGSKRVEVIRLAQADNQPAVRFRMAFAGSYGWYFAIDDFGLYSITTVSPPLLTGGPTPTPQTATAGNTVWLNSPEPISVIPISYQWRHEGTNLPGMTRQNLMLSNVSTTDSGHYDVVATNPGGSTTSSAAVLTVIGQRPIQVTGQWDFLLGNLAASYGADLQYFDSIVQSDTTFGTTTSFGIPDIGGTPTTVMHFVPSTACVTNWGGYKMYHGAAPNGGGAYVNQYTLVFDLYYPTTLPPTGDYCRWRSLWQTDTSNSNDGDLFIDVWNGLGISSTYDGYVSDGWWHRVALAIDLAGPGEAPVLTKFVDGYKAVHNYDGTRVGNQILGDGLDGRWSLDPYALVFADEDGNVTEAYVSSIQFSNGRRPDAYLEALGGPSALKVPGIIRADMVGGQVVMRWSGGVPLESADSVTGNWTIVPGTAGQYTFTPSPLEQQKFYRPHIGP